jgi:hypothetical protein
MRGLYHRVGPAEFWRRRLCWLVENGKWVSYIRLVAYLRRRGLDGACGEIADLAKQRELDPYGYLGAACRLKTIGIVTPMARKDAPL